MTARTARAVVWTGVVVLTYGAAVHVVQLLANPSDAYPWAPLWLEVYFVSLTLLDPLAAVLLALGRRIGLYLAIVVLVTDALANGYAVYWLSTGSAVAHVSQAVITVLAIAMLGLTPRLRPWLR